MNPKRGCLAALFVCCLIAIGMMPGFAGMVYASDANAAVYRLYYPATLDHHYTTDAYEYKVLGSCGWVQEGTAWLAEANGAGRPVYRLYHPGTKDHHYTIDKYEYEVLGTCGWIQEDIAWYSDAAEGVPVYRLYYPPTKDHHYTRDFNEYRVLATRGWIQEGIAWYGVDELATADRTPIMGDSSASSALLASSFRATVGESSYPGETYSPLGAATIDDFARIVVDEARIEGVRAEVVFFQAMKETGWLRFGGSVKVEQCNFCGLGAINSNPGASASFKDVREGIRAQVQHLKAYASTAPLVNACVDPRFDLVKRGTAPMLEDLDGKWAVPGDGYGASIAKMIEAALKS